ncbi:STAS domain-containing protein [Streptomyces sp. NPDC060048]|uniref:STAS domain-containing protein n=1 Tax=unclassified Streptomyces TaxID=2593676 RepID=UPI0036BC7B49
MDPTDSGALQITLRRYGPTAHLTLVGDLDQEAGEAIAGVRSAVLRDDVVVIACDVHHVPFMDVSGLRCLLDLREQAREHGITVLAYNWQPQPMNLLYLLDRLEPGHGTRLRALRDIPGERDGARRVLGADTARETSALVGADRRGSARRPEPGPPPPAR